MSQPAPPNEPAAQEPQVKKTRKPMSEAARSRRIARNEASRQSPEAQARRAEKEAQTAERMKPRLCKFAACGVLFTPKRPQDWKSEFCCREHQAEFWVRANQISSAIVAGNVPSPIVPSSQLQPGVSHREQVLAILERNVNRWVEHPGILLPGVCWRDRVATLRREGHNIQSRKVGEQPIEMVGGYIRRRDGRFIPQTNWRKFLPGGNVEYQYMLVRPK